MVTDWVSEVLFRFKYEIFRTLASIDWSCCQSWNPLNGAFFMSTIRENFHKCSMYMWDSFKHTKIISIKNNYGPFWPYAKEWGNWGFIVFGNPCYEKNVICFIITSIIFKCLNSWITFVLSLFMKIGLTIWKFSSIT